jgi:xylan 1,4-beta-xylosidase
MINFQGLKKPSFHAYQFLNRLGEEELVSSDPDSWVTKDKRSVQVLFWNYTPPKTKESNQVYFKRDLPARQLGPARISITGLPSGNYAMNVYRIGYDVNDVYTDYFKMGSPPTLTREQVSLLARNNDGRAILTHNIQVKPAGILARDLPLRENDVYLVTLQPDRQ